MTESESMMKRIEWKLDAILEWVKEAPKDSSAPLLTIEEAAKHYRVAKSTLYKIKNVQVKIGRRVLINPDAMNRYCSRRA